MFGSGFIPHHAPIRSSFCGWTYKKTYLKSVCLIVVSWAFVLKNWLDNFTVDCSNNSTTWTIRISRHFWYIHIFAAQYVDLLSPMNLVKLAVSTLIVPLTPIWSLNKPGTLGRSRKGLQILMDGLTDRRNDGQKSCSLMQKGWIEFAKSFLEPGGGESEQSGKVQIFFYLKT